MKEEEQIRKLKIRIIELERRIAELEEKECSNPFERNPWDYRLSPNPYIGKGDLKPYWDRLSETYNSTNGIIYIAPVWDWSWYLNRGLDALTADGVQR